MTDELNEITFCDECPYSGEPNGCNRKGGVCRAHDYCFDLRDERDALKSENAELHERLKKAVELPCKVGNTVYQHDQNGNIYECKIKNIIYDTNSIAFDESAIGESIFLTREAVEARIAELKGETKWISLKYLYRYTPNGAKKSLTEKRR